MRNILRILIIVIFASSCNPAQQSADNIIDSAIEYHGGKLYDTLNVKFQFRDKLYALNHSQGKFRYERIFEDSTGKKINDILDNDGFKRLIEGQKVALPADDSAAYANSVNSVHYFALLPYNLEDDAVIATNENNALIGGKPYKTVKVKFTQEGGGTDYEDVFMFWFDAETFALDYFAYSYHTEGGGVRFRESINKQEVNGVIFQDYNNFKAEKGTDLIELPKLFKAEKLELLSVIDLEFEIKNP